MNPYPESMWAAVAELAASSERGIIAIDGPAGSGKSTLAHNIANRFTENGRSNFTVHMDDLYNGWDDALTQTLTNSLSTLVSAHLAGGSLVLPRYDWLASHYAEPIHAPAVDLLILEGVGSSQRAIRHQLSLSIWIECAAEMGLARVLAREPAIDSARMQEWQIREREHFERDESKVAANIKILT